MSWFNLTALKSLECQKFKKQIQAQNPKFVLALDNKAKGLIFLVAACICLFVCLSVCHRFFYDVIGQGNDQ